jgi:F-type H+-transporting ATPase subunit gamma
METLDELQQRIESTRDLESVVKTMKALAAARIRQYEKAVDSLSDYYDTIDMALRVALRDRPHMNVGARAGPKNRLGAVVFGSDQGMCGQLNDQVASHALDEMTRSSQVEPRNRLVLAVGERVRGRLEDAGQPVAWSASVPGAVTVITSLVQMLLAKIEAWQEKEGPGLLFLFYSKHLSGASYRPQTLRLLPLDREWLAGVRKKEWPNRCLPMFTMNWDPLFSALIRQYLFVSIFRASAESLASENASRLAAMQGAERNIQKQLGELNQRYHQQRQMSITEELLDIVAGFEALAGG